MQAPAYPMQGSMQGSMQSIQGGSMQGSMQGGMQGGMQVGMHGSMVHASSGQGQFNPQVPSIQAHQVGAGALVGGAGPIRSSISNIGGIGGIGGIGPRGGPVSGPSGGPGGAHTGGAHTGRGQGLIVDPTDEIPPVECLPFPISIGMSCMSVWVDECMSL